MNESKQNQPYKLIKAEYAKLKQIVDDKANQLLAVITPNDYRLWNKIFQK